MHKTKEAQRFFVQMSKFGRAYLYFVKSNNYNMYLWDLFKFIELGGYWFDL